MATRKHDFEVLYKNIQIKIGKSPEELFEIGIKTGIISKTAKASIIINWLKSEFGLGHGYSQALWLYFKPKINVTD